MKDKNRGSATIEVTFLMPILLFLMVLFITMLLGGYRQAKLHSDLVVYSVESGWGNRTEVNENVRKAEQNDLILYSQEDEIQFTKQYKLEFCLEQRKRISDTEEKLRRWQIFGIIISDGRISSIYSS